MSVHESIFKKLKQYPTIYAILILPYYFSRFIYFAIKEKSIWYCRYYPGHYGSTIPSAREVTRNYYDIISCNENENGGIDLNQNNQLELLKRFTEYFIDFTPAEQPEPGKKYYYNNPMFGFNDGFILFCFLRFFKPKKVIEIGSGYSSALMIDTDESFLDLTEFCFIDPYSTNITKLLPVQNPDNYKIIRQKIQDIDLDFFSNLKENDILFIDSSHVVKIASDLSYILFSIIPSLKKGVIVHIHDIWWPWEYPLSMINEGRIWNEIYFIRSFLQYNSAYEILFFNSYIEQKHKEYINNCMPGYFKDSGKSLWLKKTS